MAFTEPVNWDGGNGIILQPLLKAVDTLTAQEQERIRLDAERIDQLAGEVGQTALFAVAGPDQLEILRTIATAHARALWLFLHDPGRFRHAEEAAFFENARRGKTWDGFVAPAGLDVNRDQVRLQSLAHDVREFFREGYSVKVELFDRTRPGLDGLDHELIQVSVFREGLPDSIMVFQDEDLERLLHRPVFEIGFTYEPATDVIEVIAGKKANRRDLVRMFASHLLDLNIDGKTIPLRHYDLSVFMEDRIFPTDPEDGIAEVRLRSVKLETLDGRTFVTVEARTPEETVHEASRHLFGERDPFRGGYRIREAILIVRFHPDSVNPRGRTIALKFRHPNGCDLKEKTDKERRIAEKYLDRWGLVEKILF